jgi:hypothetical protein
MVRTGKHQGAISNIKIDFQNISSLLGQKWKSLSLVERVLLVQI